MITYGTYKGEDQLEELMHLISKDLSEPYSIFTYRYFIHNWPHLCLTAIDSETGSLVGVVLGKLGEKQNHERKGYLAMLAVDVSFRGQSIGSKLVKLLMNCMIKEGVCEIVLETEATNERALRLYAKLGFVRQQRLPRYYLNGSDAFRLKFWTR